MPVLGLLSSWVHKALFLRGEEGFRAAHWASKLVFFAAALWLLAHSRSLTPAISLILLTSLLGFIDKGSDWVVATLALSSIPAAWGSLTTCIMLLTGYSITPALLIAIFARTLAISSTVLFAGSVISPARLYNVLFRLGLESFAVAPLFTWRIVPYGLNIFAESLAMARVKGEGVRSRVAPAVGSLIELGESFREASYAKLSIGPSGVMPLETCWLHTALLLAATAIVAMLAATV